ncbi:MAG: type II secretion system F family protein [Planctomycetota bacterium]|nr:type II secretion system F family protein [Planctomycetota bacterium]
MGEIDATGRSEAITLLAEDSVYVTEIADSKAKVEAKTAFAFRLPFRRRVKPRTRAAMLRQLATALQAGLPLLSALQVVQQQAENRALHKLVTDLAGRVQAGESLSEAFAANPQEFSRLDVSMVSVGETAGVLDEVMGHLSDFAERDVDIREKIRSAATYPVFVLSLAVISVVVIVTVILPQVISTVTDSVGAAALPAPTRILLWISEVSKAYGWLLTIALVAGVWAFRAWLARPQGRMAFDRFKLRLPVLGTAVRRIAVARFARTLGTLSKSGIQILEALGVLRDTLGNEALASKIDEVAADITRGRSIAEPLRQTGEFPPLLIQVIAMGEKTGRLDELLLQTADAYEKETAAAVQRVMTILPAVLIVLLALVVMFILAAVLLPVVGMETSIPGM